MKHYIGVAVLVIILTALVGVALNTLGLLPDLASLQGQFIDELFQVHTWIIAFLFALIIGFMLYSVIAFRRKDGDESDAAHIEGNNKLEVTWTVIPLITVLGVAALGANTLSKVTAICLAVNSTVIYNTSVVPSHIIHNIASGVKVIHSPP